MNKGATSYRMSSASPVIPSQPRAKRRVSAFWLKQFHTWHWMSSAICLVGMVLFAITGITLNHASAIEGSPAVETRELSLPPSVSDSLGATPSSADTGTPVPLALEEWLGDELGVSASGRAVEWTELEVYIPLPRPGGDGWVAIDRETGAVLYEDTERGWIAYLNDLHKGRDSGAAWSWFIDIFAVACVIFSLTGLLLLQIHAKHRRSTWPIVGAGVVIPVFLLIFLMH